MHFTGQGGGDIRRCNSLPQLVNPLPIDDHRPEISHQNQSKRGRPASAKQKYGGRFSLSKAQRGGKSHDEFAHGHVRIRNSSFFGRGDRPSRHENHAVYDEVYQCLVPEQSQPINDVVQPSAPISTATMLNELAKIADNRTEYNRSLHWLLCTNVKAKLSRLSEKTTLGSVRKTSQQVILVSRKNERFKWSDVLWLQLQAAIAGRQMKSPHCQIKSTHEHDQYLVAEREKCKAVLEEIRNFHFNEAEPSSPVSPSTEVSNQDSLKAKLKVVRNLLERYESFVTLYPNIRNMERATNLDEVVKTRIQIIYAWYNISMDLFSRIREVGVILGMYKDETSNRRVSLSPNVASSCSSTGDHPLAVLTWPSLDSPEEVKGSSVSSRKSSDISHVSSAPQSTLATPQVSVSTSTDLPALLEQPHNIYTAFVSRSLRRKGMRKVLQRLHTVCSTTVKKVVVMLEKSPVTYAEAVGGGKRRHSVDYTMALTPQCYVHEWTSGDTQKRDLPRNLTSHQEFLAMKLPSFQNLFLFLVRVPLDLVHEWLKMRGSAQLPSDLLTLQTVIEDFHDCIDAAILVKHKFVSLVQLAGIDNKVLFSCLAPYEDDLGEVFKSYLKCVRDWAREEVGTEGVGAEWTERVIHSLTSEWTIAKRFAVNVICGESETVHRFCMIAGDLMRKMVNDYLPEKENLLEECRSVFENASLDGPQEFEKSSPRRQASQIFIACRHFKSLVGQMKDRSLRSLTFARMLLMDIEICALYRFKYTDMRTYLYQLLVSHHSLVVISNNIPNVNNRYVIFCDKNASENIDFVRILLNTTCSRYPTDLPKTVVECTGYLLIIPLQSYFAQFCQEMWSGTCLTIELDTDTELSLRYLQLSNVDACLVAINAISLPKMRGSFARNMTMGHDFMFEVLEEQASCHDIVIERAKQLKESASSTCHMLFDKFAGKMIEDVLDGRELSSLDVNELESVRATLIQAYNLAFEYHREFYRILSRQDRRSFARQTVYWTKQWQHFTSLFVHPGDGTVPLWSIQSFQFLIMATNPELTGELMQEEYQDLVRIVDACVAHVVGSSAPDSGLVDGTFFEHELDSNSNIYGSTDCKPYSTTDGAARAYRMQELLRDIDNRRNRHLEAENKIGRVREGGRRALSLTAYFNPKKRAPFEWQRLEKKIGSGKFGTVYVVMNLTENCLMAMKQIRIERNDKALLALVDEVENLRSLDHPNLVKYYAVEVHREELLIFMEYCSEGTLEEVCREGLLDMRCVRRYTHFLLKGVEYIHMKMIIHRDIKPANIFLGKKDVLKLGDFGSSVRLKDITTACGEVADWVGTPAYMAPEVQTLGGRAEICGKEELLGYGRAADIWSVGCVVLEMCTGKPPWHECEQVLQIVFRVGSGMRPTIPQSLQADATCYSFLDQCFQAEPSKRATAEQLRQHPFANINVGESCDSRRSFFY